MLYVTQVHFAISEVLTAVLLRIHFLSNMMLVSLGEWHSMSERLILLDPCSKGIMILQNIKNHSAINTGVHLRKCESPHNQLVWMKKHNDRKYYLQKHYNLICLMWIRSTDVMKNKTPVKLTNTLLSPTK
jgi:hypothetical protein